MSTIENVIYIHTHDSGKYFSPYGFDLPTPNLEKFSQDAMVFDQAFCVSPTCSPSRTALLTGQYSHTNGMMGLTNRGFLLNDYSQHLVQILNRHNFHTVLCGIQHEYGRYVQHQLGADHIGYKENITQDNTGYKEHEMVYWDGDNAQSAYKWLVNKGNKQPFFLSFGMFSTHREYPEPDDNLDIENIEIPAWLDDTKEIRDDFAGHITSLKHFDDNFNIVINGLKEAGLYEKTLILITTDHGIAFPFAKCTLKDAGIGVSLIIRNPDCKKGNRYSHPISHVDILPTILSLLDIPIPDNVQGIDFSEIFEENDKKIRDYTYSEVNFHTSYEPIRCVRSKAYKYIKYFDDKYNKYNLSNMDNSLTKDYYIHKGLDEVEKDMEQLYDLKNDPYEIHNLAYDDNYVDIKTKLKDELYRWMAETEDPLLKGNIEFQSNWKISKPSAVDPKSKNDEDYLTNN